jgi:hypothetical protein
LSSFSAACPLFVLTPSTMQRLVFWAGVLGRGSFVGMFPWGSRVGSLNGSLGRSNHGSGVFVLWQFLGILLRKNGRHCLWGQKSTLPVSIWPWRLGGRYMDNNVQLFCWFHLLVLVNVWGFFVCLNMRLFCSVVYLVL